MDYFLQNIINALQWGSFYALIALGYSMVYSIMMLFNFAHGDIFMTGSYIGFGIATLLLALAASALWRSHRFHARRVVRDARVDATSGPATAGTSEQVHGER